MTENYSASDELLSKCERMLWRTLPSVLHGTRKLAQDELFGDLQLTPAQFHTIRNIHRGANSVSDLAACERVSPPAISRHVDDLVNMGLVERTRRYRRPALNHPGTDQRRSGGLGSDAGKESQNLL